MSYDTLGVGRGVILKDSCNWDDQQQSYMDRLKKVLDTRWLSVPSTQGNYTSSPLDLISSLERHQKKEDHKQNLESILTSNYVYLQEIGPLDLGGSIKMHTLIISSDSVEIWLEDPESYMRYYRCTKDKLLGSKDIKEVIIRAIKG